MGIIVLAAFGSKENTAYTIDELMSMYQTPEFLVYGISLVFLVSGLYAIYLKCVFVSKTYGKSHAKYQPLKKLHPLSCAALSGCLGAQSILCAKSVAEMIKESAGGNMQFDRVHSWLIVFGMVFFVFSQIHW